MYSVENVFVCLTIAYFITMTSSVAVPQAFSTPSPECVRKCSNCPTTQQCAPGVSLVTDECGCCKTCARQLGETCDEGRKCDPHKHLYCSYSDIDDEESLCAALPGRSCYSGGRTYLTGEYFDIGCKVTCTCIDGHLGCAPKCPITITASAPKNCLHPRLVTKPNQCCEEWVCAGGKLNNTTSVNPHPHPAPARPRLQPRPVQYNPQVFASAKREDPIAISIRPQDKCKIQTTEWSPCSKTCGWGISERITTDNKACKLQKQTRLCQLRPCRSNFVYNIKRGKKCMRTVKAQRKVRYSFSNCHSKVYIPKYCGACTDGRCCAPKNTVTKAIRFTCEDGFRFKKRMMIIKSCECSRKCPSSGNDLFTSYRNVGGDTWRN